MPYLLMMLLGRVLLWIAAGVVFRALSALGFGYLTYVGVGSLLDNIESYVKSLFGSIPTEILQILGIAKFDIAINLILAALMARLFLVGMDKLTGTVTALALMNKAAG